MQHKENKKPEIKPEKATIKQQQSRVEALLQEIDGIISKKNTPSSTKKPQK